MIKTDKVVALCSGGMDSVTLAYWLGVQEPQAKLYLLSVYYGQRHAKEIASAREAARALDADHATIEIPHVGALISGSGSVLVDETKEVPEGHYAQPTMRQTVVPNRNMIMLSVAIGWAVTIGASSVYAAMHAGDHPVYPDCRPEFVRAIDNAAVLATESFGDVRVFAPFVNMSKAQIASIGNAIGVPFEKTWSCYLGGDRHCGRCSTCVERLEALHDAGVEDKTEYSDPTFWRTVV